MSMRFIPVSTVIACIFQLVFLKFQKVFLFVTVLSKLDIEIRMGLWSLPMSSKTLVVV